MTSDTHGGFARARVEYTGQGLHEAGLPAAPAELFLAWYEDAAHAGGEPNAMILSTAGVDGPQARTVLLKGFDSEGFWFYTNYGSAKAREIAVEPRVALVFPWHHLQRQIRVVGTAVKAPAERSDEYFASRDRFAQLTAWASRQSEPAADRAQLERQLTEIEERFGEGPVPRPEFWGGYIVRPRAIEFWAGRRGRFHDRLVYTADGDEGGGNDVVRRAGSASRPSPEDPRAWRVERKQP